MNAVAEAKGYITDFLDWTGLPSSKGLQAAASFFRLPPSTPRKIFYNEAKSIDADKLDLMRTIYEERLSRLKALKEKNDENQRRINELVYFRNESRGRPLA